MSKRLIVVHLRCSTTNIQYKTPITRKHTIEWNEFYVMNIVPVFKIYVKSLFEQQQQQNLHSVLYI
jgi:hypothetical protein